MSEEEQITLEEVIVFVTHFTEDDIDNDHCVKSMRMLVAEVKRLQKVSKKQKADLKACVETLQIIADNAEGLLSHKTFEPARLVLEKLKKKL